MAYYKKTVGPSAIRARERNQELHEKLRKVGLICLDCGEQKRYEDFPMNRSGKITPTKPCSECQKFNKKKRKAIPRLCPACGEGRRPSAFHKSGLCLSCHLEQQKISKTLGKICPVCNTKKQPLDFTAEGYCKACATFLAVHQCSLCCKGFQKVEMMPEQNTCVYCTFERGTEDDVIALRALVRSDRISAIKMGDYIKKLLTCT